MTWKPVVGYVGLYEVSPTGLVRNARTGRLLAGGVSSRGYRVVTLWKDGTQRPRFVHRLVAEAFVPRGDPSFQVNHKDGNKFNNNVGNLEWMSCADNVRHAFATGLIVRGSNGKLSHAVAAEIRRRWSPQRSGKRRDNSQRALAAEFGVSQTTIWGIVNGVTWKDVAGMLL